MHGLVRLLGRQLPQETCLTRVRAVPFLPLIHLAVTHSRLRRRGSRCRRLLRRLGPQRTRVGLSPDPISRSTVVGPPPRGRSPPSRRQAATPRPYRGEPRPKTLTKPHNPHCISAQITIQSKEQNDSPSSVLIEFSLTGNLLPEPWLIST